MTDANMSSAGRDDAGAAEARRSAAAVLPRMELPDAAQELLAIVRYLTAADGPLQRPPGAELLSPWHTRVLRKAMERLDVIDPFLRGRVAFFIAGKDRGYGPFDGELELAGAALDNCRADRQVVEALLEGRTPTPEEFDAMARTAMEIYPALAAEP